MNSGLKCTTLCCKSEGVGDCGDIGGEAQEGAGDIRRGQLVRSAGNVASWEKSYFGFGGIKGRLLKIHRGRRGSRGERSQMIQVIEYLLLMLYYSNNINALEGTGPPFESLADIQRLNGGLHPHC
jgi:hypothetical protein